VRLLAYRLAQEAISNAHRHAQARQVSVRAEPRNHGLAVTISDDGKGIDREVLSRPEAGHLGVVHTRQLAEAAGGWWSVSSAPNAGTTVVFGLPDPDLVSTSPPSVSVPTGAGRANGRGDGRGRRGGAQAGAGVTPARSGPRSR
jgi:signal transduction histidine kinase